MPTTQSTQSDDDRVVTAQAFDIPGTTSDVAELVVLTIDGDADYIELQLDDAATADCSVCARWWRPSPRWRRERHRSPAARSRGATSCNSTPSSSSPATGPPPSPLPSTTMTAAGLTVEPGTPDDTYRAFSGSGVDGALSWYENVSDATTTLSISLYVPA